MGSGRFAGVMGGFIVESLLMGKNAEMGSFAGLMEGLMKEGGKLINRMDMGFIVLVWALGPVIGKLVNACMINLIINVN